MNDIRNLSYAELVRFFRSINEKSFRTTQVFSWIYKKNAWSFDEMRNLPQDLRVQLSQKFTMKHIVETRQCLVSTDGTAKFLFDLKDYQKIETVFIPTAKRATICVSTQAGCKFGCKFCASGIGGWKRNLTVAEILGQILWVKKYVGAHGNTLVRDISHVVFMGVGEPFDNFENLMKAIRIINDKRALNIGARRITISTCGIVPKIRELAEEGLQIELSISLHGYDNTSRNALMPVNRKYSFDNLIEACRSYIKTTRRQITFEYILIKDFTCSPEAVKCLKKAFHGLICKMNLIVYNPIKEFGYRAPSREEISSFKGGLAREGIHATIRTPRGKDISAACGQLRHADRN